MRAILKIHDQLEPPKKPETCPRCGAQFLKVRRSPASTQGTSGPTTAPRETPPSVDGLGTIRFLSIRHKWTSSSPPQTRGCLPTRRTQAGALELQPKPTSWQWPRPETSLFRFSRARCDGDPFVQARLRNSGTVVRHAIFLLVVGGKGATDVSVAHPRLLRTGL